MYNYIVHGVKYIHITIHSPFDEKSRSSLYKSAGVEQSKKEGEGSRELVIRTSHHPEITI